MGDDNKQIASNRKALHDYEILDRIESSILRQVPMT